MPAYAAAAAQIREKKGREGRRGKNQQESILIEQVREEEMVLVVVELSSLNFLVGNKIKISMLNYELLPIGYQRDFYSQNFGHPIYEFL